MGDPSAGIPPQLIHHVHLLCTYGYPYAAMLPLNQAFQYLLDAPRVVKQVAPMTFQYLTAPQDGTVLLTYSPPRLNDMFPSDGYVWGGQEERMVQDCGGYTVEIAVQHAGFRPGVDAMASHQRRRYRIVQKNPNVNASPPDRNLWIVHYTRAEPQRMMPTSQVPISQFQGVQMQQRHLIEQQGNLETHEFMLHDREKWPVIKFVQGRGFLAIPAAAQQGNINPAIAHLDNARFAGQHYQQHAQGGIGPSPAKRQRTSTMGQTMSGAQMVEFVDEDVDGENNIGDVLDVMSQREVSFHRFKQHHEWMEEVVSSPYATNQIEPVYLGLGLMGELSGLTKGVFETVEDAARQLLKEGNSHDKPYATGKIPEDKMKQFQDRVEKYLGQGQLELQRMKDEHAKKLAELRKAKSISKAERRLRNARWVDEEDVAPTLNGLVSGRAGSMEKADDVIGEVERTVGDSITPQRQVKLVEAGGLKEKVVLQHELPENGTLDHQSDDLFDTALPNGQFENFEAPPSFGQAPNTQAATNAQGLAGHHQAHPQQLQQQHQRQQQQMQQRQQDTPMTQNHDGRAIGEAEDEEPMTTLNEDETNFNIDDMDLDMAGSGDFDFGAASGDGPTPQASTTAAQGTDAGASSATLQSASSAPIAAANTATDSAPASTAPPAAAATEAASAEQATSIAAPAAPSQNPSTTQPTAGAAGTAGTTGQDLPSFHPTPGDNSAFDEFTADDGLIDFGGGEEEGETGGAAESAAEGGVSGEEQQQQQQLPPQDLQQEQDQQQEQQLDLDLGIEESAFGDAFQDGQGLDADDGEGGSA